MSNSKAKVSSHEHQGFGVILLTLGSWVLLLMTACDKSDLTLLTNSEANSFKARFDYPGFHDFLTYSQPEPPDYRTLTKANSQAIVRLIGVDGVGWPEMNLMLAKQEMPNLRDLLGVGAAAVLRTDTASSPVAWTTIACGKNRRWHGILTTEETGKTPFTYTEKSIKVPRVWDMFRYHKIKARVSKYYFVAGGDYINEDMVDHCEIVLRETAKQDYGLFATYIDATDYWQDQALLAFYLRETKWGQNFNVDPLWTEWVTNSADALMTVFRQMDNLIGRLLLQYPNDYLIIVSDHGFRVDQPELNLEIMPDSNWFLPKRQKTKLPPAPGETSSKTTGRWEVEPGFYLDLTQESRSFRLATNKTTGKDILLPVTTTRIALSSPENRYQDEMIQVRRELLQLSLNGAVVFSDEPDGTMRITDALIYAFSLAVTPESMRVFDPVLQIFYRVAEFGRHHEADQGIFLAYGPTINKGVVVSQLDLVDVTPTLLYLGGLPVGRDMDGKVAVEIIQPDFLASHPITYLDSYDPLIPLDTKPDDREALSPERRKLYQESGYPGLD